MSGLRMRRSAATVAAALAVALVGLLAGTPTVTPCEAWAALDGGDPWTRALIVDHRIPRLLFTACVGGATALAGALLQAAFRNPLAEPGLLGVPAAAATGALIGLLGWGAWMAQAPLLLSGFALLGAVALTLALDAVARRAHPEAVLVVGAVGATALTALNLTLATVGDRRHYERIYGWMAGSMSAADWHSLLALAALILPLSVVALALASRLDVLALGDECALGLGVRVGRTRRLALALACGLSAACVANGAAVLFVGLLAPHWARGWAGYGHRRLLPMSFAFGGGLLVIADALGRLWAPNAPLPAGITVALIGGPLFLMWARRRRGWRVPATARRAVETPASEGGAERR